MYCLLTFEPSSLNQENMVAQSWKSANRNAKPQSVLRAKSSALTLESYKLASFQKKFVNYRGVAQLILKKESLNPLSPVTWLRRPESQTQGPMTKGHTQKQRSKTAGQNREAQRPLVKSKAQCHRRDGGAHFHTPF